MNIRRDAKTQAALEPIKRLYMLGVKGDADAVQEAGRRLEALRSADPDLPLAKAYHGGVKILTARDRKKPMEKLRLSREGLKLLDEAVAAAPNDTDVRIIRGRCAYQLPEKYFARAATAIEDYNFILKEYRRGALQIKREEIETMQFELGDAYRRIGKFSEAAAVWKKLLESTADPVLRERIAGQLPDVQGKPNLAEPPQNTSAALLLVSAAVRKSESLVAEWMRRSMKEQQKKRRKKKK